MGYEKMLFVGLWWLVMFDFYLFMFFEGCEVLLYIDKVVNGKYYRLNIVLK